MSIPNSAGNRVFASASISDATGVVTTVATAGTYVTVGTAAPLVAGDVDGSGGITYALATNRFTVANQAGIGKLRLEANLPDVIGTNSAFFLGAWHRIRAGVTTVVSPILRCSEPATAVRNPRGSVIDYVDALLGDTFDFRFDAQTSTNTVTTRSAHFVVEKIASA